MSADQRLAEIARALNEAGLPSLVMGGHAVRYYGVDRNTVDFDFYASAGSITEVRERLSRSGLLQNFHEGPSWRPADFARFQLGRLPDGREEWLEFWLHNHLLPDFGQLQSRRERGMYGGEEVSFLSLPDLLRSKETERESDWQDIALLEEVQDARNFAAAVTEGGIADLLLALRSVRGFKRAAAAGLLQDTVRVQQVAANSQHPVTFAFLAPLIGNQSAPRSLRWPIDPAYLPALTASEFGGSRHLALVEVVRRAYKRHAMELDRQDKQSRLRHE